MKYLILIGDGMGDRPIASLGDLTPLARAHTPNMDRLAQNGQLGRVKTIPDGLPPGSDVAIMSLMGFNPQGVLTGRGPLEALALKVPLAEGELAFRLNLVTIEFGERTVIRDHSAGDISSPEAKPLLEALREGLPLAPGQTIYQGFSYRNVLVWPGAPEGLPSIPPHDWLDRPINATLEDPAFRPLAELVRASWPLLANHPVNQARVKRNLRQANSLWLWGQGRKPNVKTYFERWGLNGATVSAVDIIRGLGLATGLKPLTVEGATGGLDTNFQGKVEAALSALKQTDLVVIHLEAPDETSHQGQLALKLQAIESFDAKIVGATLEGLDRSGEDYRLIVACDHYTPLEIKTHSDDPVPFILYDSRGLVRQGPPALGYSEAEAEKTGFFVPDGLALGRLFFGPEKGL
ncbi:MAG: cofactor-independent phosphoglycerate mutase [Deltaproteobacteria bacterium]|jgi:2,3-bisphosphoglycerate-independent phosphoglycerate mutase|nr:cofactor-independent phosphoglycerate mutase [Deltaproteobacteria bacterium]